MHAAADVTCGKAWIGKRRVYSWFVDGFNVREPDNYRDLEGECCDGEV